MRPRRPGAAEIAREAGVSVATVSRALNRPEAVQPDTRARVQAIAARIGYRPDRRAQALALGRSRTVGVIVPTLDSPIFSAMLQALQPVLEAGGHHMLVASHAYGADREAAAIAQLSAEGVDGLVVVGGERSSQGRSALASAGLPLVQLWCGTAEHDCIAVDNAEAGRLVASHLAALGHRSIGVLCGKLDANDRQRARLAGLREGLAAHGIPLPDSHVVPCPLTLGSGRAAVRQLMKNSPQPTAIAGLVDLLAIGALIELSQMGRAVPASLSVMGIDNMAFAAHVAPALSTIDIPAEAIGTEAGRLILDRLGGAAEGPPIHRTLPVRLILRASTGPAPR